MAEWDEPDHVFQIVVQWLLSKLPALEVPKGKETYQQDPVHCPQWGWLDSHSDHSAFAKAEAGEDFSGASENPYGIHACFSLPTFF